MNLSLLHYIDVDGDGQISYSEFFQSFELSDPSLAQTLQRSKSIRSLRQGGDDEEEKSGDAGAASSSRERGSLSPQHASDDSPPRGRRSLNDASDHDGTSSSHMRHAHAHPTASKSAESANPPQQLTPEEEQAAAAIALAAKLEEEATTDEEGEGDDQPANKKRKTEQI